jgi:hypothetical protein
MNRKNDLKLVVKKLLRQFITSIVVVSLTTCLLTAQSRNMEELSELDVLALHQLANKMKQHLFNCIYIVLN